MTKNSHSFPLTTKTGPVLVTGGCGYIGSHICLALQNQGIEIVVVDNLSRGYRQAVPPQTTFYQVNFGDPSAMSDILRRHRIQAILHFAAYIAVEESVHDPFVYYQNNTCNTLNLIKCALDANVSYFIFSSTAAVYGTPSVELVDESQPIKPESPYGQTKAMSEQILKDLAANTALKYAILRYFNVAGAHYKGGIGQRSLKSTHLIKVAAEAAVGKRSEMTIYGDDYPTRDGTCIRDYIHVDDLAEAHLAALNYLVGSGKSDIFNCGYGKGYSVKEVLKAMAEVTGKPTPWKIGPRRSGDAVQIVADARKLVQTMGWKPRFNDLKTIVEHAYRWECQLQSEGFK